MIRKTAPEIINNLFSSIGFEESDFEDENFDIQSEEKSDSSSVDNNSVSGDDLETCKTYYLTKKYCYKIVFVQ